MLSVIFKKGLENYNSLNIIISNIKFTLQHPTNLIYKALTICNLLLCTFVSVFSQEKVRYLTIDQRLANNTNTCISKDRKSFMWFGNYDWLNRYDRYTF